MLENIDTMRNMLYYSVYATELFFVVSSEKIGYNKKVE